MADRLIGKFGKALGGIGVRRTREEDGRPDTETTDSDMLETEIAEPSGDHPLLQPVKHGAFEPSLRWWKENGPFLSKVISIEEDIVEFETAKDEALNAQYTHYPQKVIEAHKDALAKLSKVDARRVTAVKLCAPYIQNALSKALRARHIIVAMEEALRESAEDKLEEILRQKLTELRTVEDKFDRISEKIHDIEARVEAAKQAGDGEADSRRGTRDEIQYCSDLFTNAEMLKKRLNDWLQYCPLARDLGEFAPQAAVWATEFRQTLLSLHIEQLEQMMKDALGRKLLNLNRYRPTT